MKRLFIFTILYIVGAPAVGSGDYETRLVSGTSSRLDDSFCNPQLPARGSTIVSFTYKAQNNKVLNRRENSPPPLLPKILAPIARQNQIPPAIKNQIPPLELNKKFLVVDLRNHMPPHFTDAPKVGRDPPFNGQSRLTSSGLEISRSNCGSLTLRWNSRPTRPLTRIANNDSGNDLSGDSTHNTLEELKRQALIAYVSASFRERLLRRGAIR